MTVFTEIFEAERVALVSLCYRMLGERSGAEDAVQETWLKWAAADKSRIRNPSAWLRRVATNIAISTLRTAQRNREIYVGPWLPEPLLHCETCDADSSFELAQECELALLWAMERLNERERAAFILREAFDASYAEIAATLGTTEGACRQLVSRSQKKIQETGPRFDATPEEVAALSERFFMAVMAEDFETALDLLTPDSVAVTDGGAKRRAARRPLVGGAEIMQVFGALIEKSKKEQGWTTRPAVVNAHSAFLVFQSGALDCVMAVAPDPGGRVAWIYLMRNPDKLAAVRRDLNL